jgi:hypothetical protein
VTDINFKYFRCLSFMPQLSTCMLEGYGVLPSAPLNFRFSNVDTTFGILHWDRPAKLANTVVDYKVNYQVNHTEQNFWEVGIKKEILSRDVRKAVLFFPRF